VLEALAGAAAGAGVGGAILILGGPDRLRLPAAVPTGLRDKLRRAWEAEVALVAGVELPGLTLRRFVLVEACAATTVALLSLGLTGLWALAAVGLGAGTAAVRAAAAIRRAALRRARQDAVLEAVRMLRHLLETGGVGVQQALQALAVRGPDRLRADFAAIADSAASGRQREAWIGARARVAEPMFDLLAAAIELQRPGGGELTPLFAGLEESLSGIHEVTREAEALQVQARGAAALIVSLPVVFIVVLAGLGSPYLQAYRTVAGEVFLLGMLLVMAGSYAWILARLRLPSEPRLRLPDA
jgi:tight adherence protein B